MLPILCNWERQEGEQFLKVVTECEEKLDAHLCSELFHWQRLAGNSNVTGSGLPLSAFALLTFVDSHLLDAMESSWQPFSCLLDIYSATLLTLCLINSLDLNPQHSDYKSFSLPSRAMTVDDWYQYVISNLDCNRDKLEKREPQLKNWLHQIVRLMIDNEFIKCVSTSNAVITWSPSFILLILCVIILNFLVLH